ncbi:hypothetical protein KC318_g28 [Hortaea werneckii]|nr:hypothetical protein KC318_g28 [Hortaea werneckii]
MAIIILSYAEYYGANHSGKTSLCVRSSTSCSPPRRRTRSSTRSLCAISSLRIVLVSGESCIIPPRMRAQGISTDDPPPRCSA